MFDNLTEFKKEDLKQGVKFIIPDLDNTCYEIHKPTIYPEFGVFDKDNILIAQIRKISKNGFFWSKWYFGKRVTGFHRWSDLLKVQEDKTKEVTNG